MAILAPAGPARPSRRPRPRRPWSAPAAASEPTRSPGSGWGRRASRGEHPPKTGEAQGARGWKGGSSPCLPRRQSCAAGRRRPPAPRSEPRSRSPVPWEAGGPARPQSICNCRFEFKSGVNVGTHRGQSRPHLDPSRRPPACFPLRALVPRVRPRPSPKLRKRRRHRVDEERDGCHVPPAQLPQASVLDFHGQLPPRRVRRQVDLGRTLVSGVISIQVGAGDCEDIYFFSRSNAIQRHVCGPWLTRCTALQARSFPSQSTRPPSLPPFHPPSLSPTLTFTHPSLLTCAKDAEAIGVGSKEAHSASGGAPSSSSITARTSG